MDRILATKLFEIYKLEKAKGRAIYEKELVSQGIFGKHEAKNTIEELMKTYSLNEENIMGANVYSVSNIGFAHMESYLDIKRELKKI